MDRKRMTRQEYERRNLIKKKKEKQFRNRYIILQLIVFLLLSAVICSIVFIPGNGSLAHGTKAAPESLQLDSSVSSINKIDYSFLIKQIDSEISSSNAILIDLASGEIMAEKSPDEKIYPASITKIMTAIVVLEHFEDLEVLIEMPADMYTYLREQNASVAGFWAGERVKVIDLLYGVLLPSGADACLSLARSVAGNEQAFAQKMTAKAHSIGATNTNFVNSTGLHSESHYTTVRDLSKILTYALQNETFRTIFTAEKHTTSPTNLHKNGLTVYSTTFKAFERAGLNNQYVKGGKTGYTGEARLCLASLGQKNGREYILVTVGAGTAQSSRGTNHVKDADYIYGNFA